MGRVTRFNFKELDVYQEAVDFFAWVVQTAGELPWRYRRVGDQIIGSSASILGNLGEASGRRLKPAEAAQHYRYAQGSVHESAAYLDALWCMSAVDEDSYNEREQQLARMGSMVTRMTDLQLRRNRSKA